MWCTYIYSSRPYGLHAEPILLTSDETESKQKCGALKGSQGQAVDVQILSRGTIPQAPAQPATVVYQAAAGMCPINFTSTHMVLIWFCYRQVPWQRLCKHLLASKLPQGLQGRLSALLCVFLVFLCMQLGQASTVGVDAEVLLNACHHAQSVAAAHNA